MNQHPQQPPMHHDRLILILARILMGLIPLFVCIMVVAVWLIIQAPNDYQHGVTVKILYIHVPSAWLATLCYCWMVVCALMVIFRASTMMGLCLGSAAPLGAVFTAVTLVTGSLWGRVAWGSWFVWDARLTAVLILLVLYLAIIILGFIGQRVKAAAAILTLFGFCLVPIIKFAPLWWHTLHQPTSIWREEGPAMEVTMLIPLITMAIAFILLFMILQLLALRAQLLWKKLQLLQPQPVQRSSSRISASALSKVAVSLRPEF